MPTEITLREANQRFASLVREVEGGAEFVITRRGQPVARLGGVAGGERRLTPAQAAALERSIARMQAAGAAGTGERLGRDEIHDRAADRLAAGAAGRE